MPFAMTLPKSAKIVLGELLGTFVLVGIGCGAVGYSFTHPEFSLWKIALCWTAAVALGILVSIRLCHAHLNPAVSFAFLLNRSVNLKTFGLSVIGQLLGATIAAIVLYLVFNNTLLELEELNGWNRAGVSGWNTARMFGEYYDLETITLGEAFLAESFGTISLVFMIFLLAPYIEKHLVLTALFIGLTVGIIILFVAPITQCGINPARDLMPRIVAWGAGWKQAFALPNGGAFLVYVVAPMLGAAVGFGAFRLRQSLTKR